MAVTEIDPFKRFTGLTAVIQEDYAIARRATPKLITQLEASALQISKYLAGVAKLCVGDEAKSICVQPNQKIAQLAKRISEAHSNLETHATKCQGCAEAFSQWHDLLHGQIEAVGKIDELSDEDKELCRRFDFSLSPRDATWDYFAAMPTISLYCVINQFVDLMSGLVGQPRGARPSLMASINTLATSNSHTIIDQVTFNYGSMLLRGAEAILTLASEQNPVVLKPSQDPFQHVLVFKNALEKLDAQTFLVEAIVTTADAAVNHAIEDTNTIAKKATGRLRTLLERRKPQGF